MDAFLSGTMHEAEREADGFLQGLAVGVVTDNKDPDGLGRVRVRLPWHVNGQASFWARMAVLMAGGSRGTYFLPEIGDEVLLGAENGDPSHLYVIGALWNGDKVPPEANADGENNRRVIYSRSLHKLVFVDDEASPELRLSLSEGERDSKYVLLDQNGIEIHDGSNNRIRIESGSGAITIESTASLTLKSQTISIEAGASMEIKAAGTLTIKGAMVQIN